MEIPQEEIAVRHLRLILAVATAILHILEEVQVLQIIQREDQVVVATTRLLGRHLAAVVVLGLIPDHPQAEVALALQVEDVVKI